MLGITIDDLITRLEYESCDLRCRNIPTGGDDFCIMWDVVEHHMATPSERVIGSGKSVYDALIAAFGA